MPNTGDLGSPIAFLQGTHASDDRHLTLPVFVGEVMAAFDLAVKFRETVRTQNTPKGQATAVFYKTWKAGAFYHQRGVELLGENIDTTKIEITVDQPLVSPFALYDLDNMLSQFEVRSQFAQETGKALARVFDKNIARSIIIAARDTGDNPFPGGNVITDVSLVNSGTIDGNAWLDAIREMTLKFHADQDVPEDMPLHAAVNMRVFDAIRFAKDGQGHYVFPESARYGSSPRTLMWNGVTVHASQNLPTADESADASVYSKYQANYSTTTGMMWAMDAVATALMMDIQFESTRDVRRQEDFQVAKMLAGHGTLRPEVAGEFKTA